MGLPDKKKIVYYAGAVKRPFKGTTNICSAYQCLVASIITLPFS